MRSNTCLKMIFLLYVMGCELLFIGMCHARPDVPECIEDGYQANYSSGCQQYYKCSKNKIVSTYSCQPGSTFQPAFGECVSGSNLPCIQHLCGPHDTALYAAPGTQCRFYYKCNKGVVDELVCPAGTWFDIKRQECTSAPGVCYEPVCTGQRDGRHMDSTQGCRRSLICSGGNLIAVDSSHQDVDPNRCPSPRSTSVAFPIAGVDRCAYLPDGRHPSSAVRCQGYVLCKDGETNASIRCPESFLFDGENCSPVSNTQCIDGCTGKHNGFHVDIYSGCKEYFYCHNGTSLLTAICSDGMVFDGRSCVSPALYKCPVMKEKNLCYNKNDGYYRDFKDCSSYHYCANEEVALRESCPRGEVYNGTECVKQSEFYCEEPVLWSGCVDKPSGYYQDRGKDSYCRKYFHCHKGMIMKFMCNAGYVFDGEECVRGDTYTCPSLEKDTCDFKPDGFYQMTSGGCRAYYMCSRGFKAVYVCDASQVFNGEKCVDVSSYRCPFHSDECKGKPNGYHKDIKSNCRKYYVCENGEKLTTIQCTGSKIYNGQSCVSPKQYECPVGPDGNPCALNSDGYYVHERSKCRKYYKCSNYKLVSQHSCPVGQVFDGVDSCAVRNCSEQTVTCEKDGFYLDLSSRCKSYHICIDKRRNTLHCDANKVFNGQLCVHEDTFPCPDECSQNHCDNSI